MNSVQVANQCIFSLDGQHLSAKRLQGLVIDIEAEELTTAVESSYMNQGQISTQIGDVKINNLHGCTDLLVKEGQIAISK